MSAIKAHNYDVIVSTSISEELNNYFKDKGEQYSKVFVLVDDNTIQHCYPRLAATVDLFKDAELIEIEHGEENKTIDICVQVWSTLGERGADRKSLLVNVGGGVIGDMGGFIASTFKRGIDFVNIPTTLLSQVDASVGGKLGIDLNHLKNEIGVFNNPQGVFVDTSFLDTLDPKQVRSGFAEIIKHGLIADAKYWETIKMVDHTDVNQLSVLVDKSINIKNDVVLADPFEKGLRKTLNFGHTIGHAIETHFLETEDMLLHGEAIAIGMICEAYLSHKVAGLSKEALDEITNFTLAVFGKVSVTSAPIDAILGLMQHDKKNEKGVLKFSLLSAIGKCEINQEVSSEQIQASLDYYNSAIQ